MENQISEKISSFLEFLREAEQLVHIAKANEQEANDATQDILHKLELEQVSYRDSAHLARKLSSVRKVRRSAKDLFSLVCPVAQWAENNKVTIKSLERLLGDVRRAEKIIQNRTYVPKTEVLHEDCQTRK